MTIIQKELEYKCKTECHFAVLNKINFTKILCKFIL